MAKTPPTPDFDLMAARMSALADPNRLRALHAVLHSELTVNQITERVGMAQPTVSHHLRKLLVEGLVTRSKRGVHVFYQASPLGVDLFFVSEP